MLNIYQETILANILVERERQEALRKEGKFLHTCASQRLSVERKFAILSEEIGEVARDVTEIGISSDKLTATADTTWHQDIAARKRHLRKELIQSAAVIVAWIEALDEAAGGSLPESVKASP